ncbi:PspC domain-containing protein [Candidatus Gracilibacteria bacterium]|nr:PspC domain-containing protein [Candidatus Gracilibacteria bacterium]
MNKVTTINLNGRAYQLEEGGWEALSHYLDRAEKKLGENPDKEEIMGDFEQAIADKCDNVLTAHKNVITTKEIETIIAEMGPVHETDEKAGQKTNTESVEDKADKTTTNEPKRLYQIREGAMITGVCNGLAAYFNIDVTLVRIAFVGLTILTHGAWILVYIIMSIVVPYANTSEQKAEARGLPFNANELLQRAREKYAQFDKDYWKSKKKDWKRWAHEQQESWGKNQPAFAKNRGESGLVFNSIMMTLVTFAWLGITISVIVTGTLFGYYFEGVPLWVIIVLLTSAYSIALLPLRAIRSSMLSSYPYGYGHRNDSGVFGILDAIMWFTFIGIVLWLVWTYVPESHIVWEKIRHFWQEQMGTAPLEPSPPAQPLPPIAPLPPLQP